MVLCGPVWLVALTERDPLSSMSVSVWYEVVWVGMWLSWWDIAGCMGSSWGISGATTTFRTFPNAIHVQISICGQIGLDRSQSPVDADNVPYRYMKDVLRNTDIR